MTDADTLDLLRQAVALHRAGDVEDADRLYDVILAREPHHPDALNLRGLARQALGDPATAAACFDAFLKDRPDHAATWSNLGVVLAEQGDGDGARDAFERALALEPHRVDARVNLGNALRKAGAFDAARDAYEAAARDAPDLAAVPYNQGILFHQTGAYADAVAAFDRALALDPAHADARTQKGLVQLLTGDFANGWDGYAHRFDARESRAERRPYPQPRWDGTDTDGGVVVWGEQGVGDEILFAGLLAEAEARCGYLMVECEPRLVPLFERSFPSVDVFAWADGPHPDGLSADMQCAVGDLGGLFRRSADAFPPPAPYLKADAERTAALRAGYGVRGGPLVGISWRSGNAETGAARSLTAADLAGAVRAAWPDAVMVNLQYGDVRAEAASAGLMTDDTVEQMADMDGFAAQVAAMDLVVSAANTTVHVAGALGVKTHALVPAVPDWRWRLQGERSLWYPDVRLHRQTDGGWEAAVSSLVAAL